MNILVTGAFGLVGIKTLKELEKRGHKVIAFDINTPKNRRNAQKFGDRIVVVWGDLRNKNDIFMAFEKYPINYTVHLAAIIPPLADKNKKLAEGVNVGGTRNLVEVIRETVRCPILYSSSISVYGDRLKDPLIKYGDPLKPSPGDYYAVTKIKAEKIIMESGLDYVIFRLSYVVSENKLKMDPLMFHMPLDTRIEVVLDEDVAFAIAEAVERKDIFGEIFHIGGGEKCRTTYREYLNRMMELFGFGRNFLPEDAFARANFHCGWYQTDKSRKLFKYQRHSLEDYYNLVAKKATTLRRTVKFFGPLARSITKKILLSSSEFYKAGVS